MGDLYELINDYVITIEEEKRLHNIQITISGWRIELRAEYEKRFFQSGEIYLSRLRFHQGVRDTWKLIDCVDNSKN